jgi:hypothetical protein
MTVLHWLYVAIAAALAILVIAELFREKQWKNQVALVLVSIPLILRILHIK